MHHFRDEESLDYLETELLKKAKEYEWRLEAWSVFSNHYHFVGQAIVDAESLRPMLNHLHAIRPEGSTSETGIRPTGLVQLLGNGTNLPEVVPRSVALRASERGEAWTGARREPVPLVFGCMV